MGSCWIVREKSVLLLFPLTPSVRAVKIDLSNGFMNDIASELPCGHRVVMVLYSIPWISMNRPISFPLNGGPLSDATSFGMSASVKCTISTFRYPEYASVATSNSSPVGSGSRKVYVDCVPRFWWHLRHLEWHWSVSWSGALARNTGMNNLFRP